MASASIALKSRLLTLAEVGLDPHGGTIRATQTTLLNRSRKPFAWRDVAFTEKAEKLPRLFRFRCEGIPRTAASAEAEQLGLSLEQLDADKRSRVRLEETE